MDVRLTDNVVTQAARYGYSFDRVTGTATGNRLNGSPYPIPLTTTPYTDKWYA